MKENYNNIDPEHEGFFKKARIPYKRSREQVWEALEDQIKEKPLGRVVGLRTYRFAISAASLLVILIGSFLVLRFYTTSVNTDAGVQLAYYLPDSSMVQLNAGSTLSYHPLWWRFGREVRLDGEGYFEVEKGDNFSVVSDKGTTSVLGTSFNIYSRMDGYRVTCFTGSVKVVSKTKQEVVLGPDYGAMVQADGNILVTKEMQHGAARSWKEGRFSFTAIPLRTVLDEIERQYGVRIALQASGDYMYTGFFNRERSIEELLELVCKPFGLNFVKRSEKTYEVFSN